jgi:FkbM family methyltransferase
MLEQYVFYFGVYEPYLTRYVERNLASGDIFIDVGANIGYFTCLAGDIVGPTGHVHAIEASPSIFARLSKNNELNDLDNVTSHNNVVYDKQATMPVYRSHAINLGETTTFEDKAAKEGYPKEAQIAANTLIDIVGERDLFRAKLIKIDVEGSEWFVLGGIKERLDEFGDDTEWLMEVTPSAIEEQGGRSQDIFDAFYDCDYRAYRIENQYVAPWYFQSHGDDYVGPIPAVIDYQIDVLFSKKDLSDLVL